MKIWVLETKLMITRMENETVVIQTAKKSVTFSVSVSYLI